MKNFNMIFTNCSCCGKEEWCHVVSDEHDFAGEIISQVVGYYCEACADDLRIDVSEGDE